MTQPTSLAESDPDWAAYAARNNIEININNDYNDDNITKLQIPTANTTTVGGVSNETLPENEKESESQSTPLTTEDIHTGRRKQRTAEDKWSQLNPISRLGYQSHMQHVCVRDGTSIEIKVSWPMTIDHNADDSFLPLIFVCHGGGWIQGTHVTEEAWLLWPILQSLKVVVVSVAYRLVPEQKFPTYITDCQDVFDSITSLSIEDKSDPDFRLMVPFDHDKVILAGSSAGALIVAAISQQHRDLENNNNNNANSHSHILAVILNVPVLCDYRHWGLVSSPPQNPNSSYMECENALLSSADMRRVWDFVIPAAEQRALLQNQIISSSPLLGDTDKLPRHLVYVAGQDPLREEGVEYVKKLSKSNVDVKLTVYPGVPHTFAEFWELKASQKFWRDVVSDLKAVLA